MPNDSKKPAEKAVPQRRYTLQELLAQCDPKIPWAPEEREWIDAKPVGWELI